jgi:hypothetical protein
MKRALCVLLFLLKSLGWVGLLALLLNMTAFGQVSKPVVSCESLAKLVLPDTTITLVKEYAAGEYKAPAPRFGAPPSAPGARGGALVATPPRGSADGARAEGQAGGPRGGSLLLNSLGYINGPIPAFCRVTATVKTSSESNIGIDERGNPGHRRPVSAGASPEPASCRRPLSFDFEPFLPAGCRTIHAYRQ